MFPILHLGSLALPAAEVCVLLSVYFGMFLMETWLKKNSIDPNEHSNLILFSIVVFIIAGRLGYISVHYYAFTSSPIDVISLNRDLFDPFIGLTAAALYYASAAQRHTWKWQPTLTTLAMFSVPVWIGLDVAEIANGSSYGSVTSLPWAINLWGLPRHPVQIIQVFADLSIALVWVFGVFKLDWRARSVSWVVFSGLTMRFLIEALRAEGSILPGGWRENQLALLPFIVFMAWVAASQIFDQEKQPGRKQ